MRTHKDLDVWKEAVEFVEGVYKITAYFPKEEIYCLTTQIRRSAVSIPSNIAEGAARNSKTEFMQFLYVALGSCAELNTQPLIAKRVVYIKEDTILFEKLEKIKSKILGLVKYLRNKDAK